MELIENLLEPAAAAKPAIVCRQIKDADIEAVAALLCRGFPERPANYWRNAMRQLRDREAPEGFPRYGFGIFDRGVPVGALLLIASIGDDGHPRGNLSSWFVEAAYRGYSGMLQAMPFRWKNLTLFNISPAPNTIATIEAAGFRSYATGSFISIAGFGPRGRRARIRRVPKEEPIANERLRRLVAAGCVAFEVETNGERLPFAFLPRRVKWNALPGAQLAYCRSVDDFVALARPLGRRLLTMGFPIVTIDATGGIEGLVGVFRAGQPKMFRGPHPPRLGDLGDSELALFGH